MQIGQTATARSSLAASRTGTVGCPSSIWSPAETGGDPAGLVAEMGGSWSELLSRLSNRGASMGGSTSGTDDQALVREWTRDLSANDRKLVARLDGLCQRVQVAMFQAGEQFDPAVRSTGQDFLKQQAAAADSGDPLLPIAKLHYVQDLVADPTYAMSQMEKYCSGKMAVLMKLPVPANGQEGYVDPEIVHAAFERYFSFQSQVQAVHDHAKTLLEKGKAEGKSGAEIYADVLRDQLSQPDSYWQARDPDNLWGQPKEKVQAELNALEKAIAAKSA